MKTFKFGQLISKEDICDRKKEVDALWKICGTAGRAVVYGPRRFGKTSVVKNIVMANFLEKHKRALAVYADFLQVDSISDMVLRLQGAFEEALSQQAGFKSFIKNIHNYLKHFRVDVSLDPLSGSPSISLGGSNKRDESTLNEIFACIKNSCVSGCHITLVLRWIFSVCRVIKLAVSWAGMVAQIVELRLASSESPRMHHSLIAVM